MRLCFLMERQYPPYYKWFGTAFARLECAAALTPIFRRVLDSQTWKDREEQLAEAYIFVAEMHNRLRITAPLEAKIGLFHSRPYRVLNSGRFADAILAAIQSTQIKRWPLIGAVWQWADSTDVLDEPARFAATRELYTGSDCDQSGNRM